MQWSTIRKIKLKPWLSDLRIEFDFDKQLDGPRCVTSSNGNICCDTGPLWGDFTGPRWISLIKASDAELCCFLWSALEHTCKQLWGWWIETPSHSLWRHCNVAVYLNSVTMDRINVGKFCTIQSHVHLSFRILLYSKVLTFVKPTHVKPILDIVCHIHIYSEYLALFDWGSSKSNITQSTVSMGRFYTSSYMCGCLYKHI